MPKPNPGESRKDFINRCIPIVIREGTARDGSQGNAICNSIWDDHQKEKRAKEPLEGEWSEQQIIELAQEGRKPTTVQTLIMSKSQFSTRESALNWAKQHGFKSETIRETSNSWRIRQRPPSDFIQTSFRVTNLTNGVNAVIGHLK